MGVILEKARFSVELQPFQQEQRKLLQRWLAPPPGARLLDAGCGTGVLTGTLGLSGEWYGVDISPALEDFHGTRVYADLRHLPCKERFFDCTVCIDVLEHVSPAAVPAILSELARVTSDRIVLMVPNEPPLHAMTIYCPHCDRLSHPDGHLDNVNPDHLVTEMTRRGFTLQDSTQVGDTVVLGDEMLPLIFRKHFWEHQLGSSLPCMYCGKPPTAYFDGCSLDFTEVHRILAPDWFSILPTARIEWSENALCFERASARDDMSSGRDRPRRFQRPAAIRPRMWIGPDVAISLQRSPRALPASSYLVPPQDVRQSAVTADHDALRLPAGNYHCFFIAPPRLLTLRGRANHPLDIGLYWQDNDHLTHRTRVSFGGSFDSKDILLEPPPALGVEGAYVNIDISSQQPGTTEPVLLLDRIQGKPDEQEPPDASVLQGSASGALSHDREDIAKHLAQFRAFVTGRDQAIVRHREEAATWMAISQEVFAAYCELSQQVAAMSRLGDELESLKAQATSTQQKLEVASAFAESLEEQRVRLENLVTERDQTIRQADERYLRVLLETEAIEARRVETERLLQEKSGQLDALTRLTFSLRYLCKRLLRVAMARIEIKSFKNPPR